MRSSGQLFHVSQHRTTAMKAYAARARKSNNGYLPFAFLGSEPVVFGKPSCPS